VNRVLLLPLGRCLNDLLFNQQFHRGVHLRNQVLVLGDRLVEFDGCEINDHSSHLRRMLLTHDLRDVLEDSRADDLATVLNRALHELLALEHRGNLCVVLRSLRVELVLWVDLGWLRHLLSHHRLLSRMLLHHSLVVLVHLGLLVVGSRLLALVARPVLVRVGVLGTIGTLVTDVELVQNET